MINEHNSKRHIYFALVIVAVLVAIMCFGCGDSSNKNENEQDVSNVSGQGTVRTISHEGCEYIVLMGYYKGDIEHKQNCKYCFERNKIEE